MQKDYLKNKPDVVRRFLRAATRSLEESAKNPEAAVDASSRNGLPSRRSPSSCVRS